MKISSALSPRSAALARGAFLLCAAALLLVAPSAHGENIVRPLTEAETARYLAARDAARAEAAVKVRVSEGVLTAGLDEDSSQFIVPRFRVQTSNASGTTTLFAIRNTLPASVAVRVDYFSDTGVAQRVENYTLTGFDIVTRNVRDVANLASANGFKTGFIVITAPGDRRLSVDVFQVDPGNDFATGSRAVDVTGVYLCDVWDIRFLAGGIFSGGTNINLLVNSPQGTAMGADPSVVFTPTDEDGDIKGLVGLFTSRISTTVSAEDLLDALGPLPPSFGAFEVDFTSSDGGSLDAVFDADGRFSIGLEGACLTR